MGADGWQRLALTSLCQIRQKHHGPRPKFLCFHLGRWTVNRETGEERASEERIKGEEGRGEQDRPDMVTSRGRKNERKEGEGQTEEGRVEVKGRKRRGEGEAPDLLQQLPFLLSEAAAAAADLET